MSTTRVLHWNVYEDGLADTPGALGFSDAFRKSFASLLAALGGDSFFSFNSTRDFAQLPEVTPVTSITSFFGLLDCVYNVLYHTIGGDVLLDHRKPVGNALRHLFLHSYLAKARAVPGKDNPWGTPRTFELAVSSADGEAENSEITSIRDSIFDAETGMLTWDRSIAERLEKRGSLVLHKWMGIDNSGIARRRGLRVFLDPPPDATTDPVKAAALARFRSIVDVDVDADGELTRLRTPTLHHGARILISEICVHALSSAQVPKEVAKAAIVAFCTATGGNEKVDNLSDDPADWTCAIYARVEAAMKQWADVADLTHRHRLQTQHIERANADILTLVEYNEGWRMMPPPKAPEPRQYAIVHGAGTASIVYDRNRFEPVFDLADCGRDDDKGGGSRPMPTKVRSVPASAATGSYAGKPVAPKSSCISLLRRVDDGWLFLVIAVHLESGKPSDTFKVAARAEQMRAILDHTGELSAELKQRGCACTVVLAGDMNALREEFVLGNTDAFFECSSVANVRPKLRPPPASAARWEVAVPPMAELGASGRELWWRCSSCAGGWLREASAPPAAGSCTRAGSTMVIDFIMAGTIAGRHRVEPVALVPLEDRRAAADSSNGIQHAVELWGSDHLPVACDLVTSKPAAALFGWCSPF